MGERRVSRCVDDTRPVDSYHRAMMAKPDLCGLSLERQITDALREAGLLAPVAQRTEHLITDQEAARSNRAGRAVE